MFTTIFAKDVGNDQGIAYGIVDRVASDKIPMTTLGYGRSDAANGKVFPYVFPLITSYWNQAAAMISYLGKQSQWLQIRQARPDYVILWGWGVMNAVAIKTAQRNGFPREKILGVWWAGSEEDVIPAGDAAKGYTTMTFNTPGNYPVLDEIRKKVYDAGKGNLDDKTRVGSVYHMRGVTAAILWTEAIRKAQEKFGKGKVMTGEQVRWGMENLNVDEARQKALGVHGMFPPVKTSCEDHEGSGAVKVQQWNGAKWVPITPNWVTGDKALTKKLIDESSAKYAAEKKITPACAS